MSNGFRDPFGSMQGFVNQFRGFMGNPMQMMAKNKLNIPQNMQGNPQQIIQQMMNNGQINQEQYNWAQNMAKQIQGNPMFGQLMSGKR